LPAQRANPVLRRLGWLPALTGILNTVWVLVLLTGLAIVVTFIWRFHDAAYGLVIVWAYAGLVVRLRAA
jgi:hypothetical protein